MNVPDRRVERKRLWWCAVYVACLLCTLALAGGGWRAWRAEVRGVEPRGTEPDLGINVSLGQYRPDELARVLDDIDLLGLYRVRQHFPWRDIEPQEGTFDWAPWDALVSAAADHGLKMIAVLDDPPEWALRHDPYPLPCLPPCQADAYARFVAAFARRYGHTIDYYQVWDEPNLSRSWGNGHVAPCGYTVLLRAAYAAIHEADGTAYVLGGGLAPTQATGPADLNDLVYLRQLYAVGGGAYFDVLAVKPYGFWFGPDDRRIAPEVLDYSRVVAVRELLRSRGDGDKPIWAVEWGWNVLPAGWSGDPPPWGTDSLSVQRPRVVGAVARAGREWPWLEVMCWAEYQPDLPESDPRWGFALRDSSGGQTALYDVLRTARTTSSQLWTQGSHTPGRGIAVLALCLLASADACVLWHRLGCSAVAWRAWRGWQSLSWPYHLAALMALAGFYALIPWPEWALMALALAAAVLHTRPRWATWGAVWSIPLFYAAKPVAGLQMPPSEALLYIAVVGTGVREMQVSRRLCMAHRWSALDAAWGLWVVWGAVWFPGAPDPALACQEWRLCVLDPALLYLLLQTTGSGAERDPMAIDGAAVAWLLSGVAVSVVGIAQWATGSLVPAGSVGRVTGVYYSPNHLALYLERVWPVALALALGTARRRWRFRAWGATAVLGAALYLTYSRGAWLLAVPAAVIAVGWAYRRRLRWWVAAGGPLVLILVASNVLYGRSVSHADLIDEIRVPVWESTLAMIADYPWHGVGLDGYRFLYPWYMQAEAWAEPLLYHPHDMWLDAAVRLGVPGLALFAVLVFLCLREGARWARTASGAARALAVGCLASLLAGLMHGTVDSGYFLADLAWSLALVAGLARSHLDQRWTEGGGVI